MNREKFLAHLRDREGDIVAYPIQGIIIRQEDRVAADLLLHMMTTPSMGEGGKWSDDVLERAAFLMEYVVIQRKSDEMAWKPTDLDYQAWEVAQYIREKMWEEQGEKPSARFVLDIILAAWWWRRLLKAAVSMGGWQGSP